jgi:hypothetical protein
MTVNVFKIEGADRTVWEIDVSGIVPRPAPTTAAVGEVLGMLREGPNTITAAV